MTAPIRAAIIGTGMIANVHLRAARDAGADILGVLGSNPDSSDRAAKAWGVRTGYAEMDALLHDRPDVVHVCTPNGTHFDYAMAVIAAGINVVCEKPLALNVDQAAQLTAAAESAGVVATVPFVYRYHPLVREIRSRRLSGEFGRIHLLHGSYLQDWLLDPESSSWRIDAAAGGRSRAFADIGSHWCDLAEFISGEEFAAVTASTQIVYPTRPVAKGPSFTGTTGADHERMNVTTEDTAVATFRTTSGTTANTVISQVAAGRKNRLWVEMDGAKGSAVFDQEAPESIWLGTKDGANILTRGSGRISADQARLNLVPAGHPQGYPDAFAAFLRDTYSAVRGCVPEGLPTFVDGLRSAQIIDAMLASAESHTWMEIQR